jgi:16S rRNA (uracil1498-N3)-methyltransferase
MQFPFFYIADYNLSQKEINLDEDTSRHVVQVLRMKQGEKLNLTDGKGNLLTASIIDPHKKHCTVLVQTTNNEQRPTNNVVIGISLIKNSSRFEWFLEKATEIGVTEIIPLICDRTEKQKFRSDRMHGIVISAMLQSQQCWLPVLHEPIAYELLFRQEEVAGMNQKFIAHCIEDKKQNLAELVLDQPASKIILIGPEGDFTPDEIELAVKSNFIPVSLGNTRLRTETAGIVAASIMKQ